MNGIEIDENNMKNFEDKLSAYDELYSKSSLNVLFVLESRRMEYFWRAWKLW